jgi:hypothetical protein
MSSREAVDDVTGERLLRRGLDRPVSLFAALQPASTEMNFVTVWVDESPVAGGCQIAGPADVTVRMPDVIGRPGVKQANEAGSKPIAITSGYAQLDGHTEPIPTPHAADERVGEGEDAILQPKRGAPE